ncbi:NUDIX domain-containing protein [Novosphingobium sp.]|uniref:NUDIX hydrolase n=1 Tax=Novosphingobium sp. TaxID=1874826 RepID=UPI0025D28EDF|nr:NUDIX domain-containing protein [Novosphingobium sp.]
MNEAAPVAQRRIRRAARILLFDGAGRLLLFRFTAPGRTPFWATASGECDPGEDYADAARRELFEETGIVAEPGPPIHARGNDFVTFDGEPVTADERYFRVVVEAAEVDTSGHTELERAVMREHRWFSRSELASWHEPIFPPELLDLLDRELLE